MPTAAARNASRRSPSQKPIIRIPQPDGDVLGNHRAIEKAFKLGSGVFQKYQRIGWFPDGIRLPSRPNKSEKSLPYESNCKLYSFSEAEKVIQAHKDWKKKLARTPRIKDKLGRSHYVYRKELKDGDEILNQAAIAEVYGLTIRQVNHRLQWRNAGGKRQRILIWNGREIPGIWRKHPVAQGRFSPILFFRRKLIDDAQTQSEQLDQIEGPYLVDGKLLYHRQAACEFIGCNRGTLKKCEREELIRFDREFRASSGHTLKCATGESVGNLKAEIDAEVKDRRQFGDRWYISSSLVAERLGCHKSDVIDKLNRLEYQGAPTVTSRKSWFGGKRGKRWWDEEEIDAVVSWYKGDRPLERTSGTYIVEDGILYSRDAAARSVGCHYMTLLKYEREGWIHFDEECRNESGQTIDCASSDSVKALKAKLKQLDRRRQFNGLWHISSKVVAEKLGCNKLSVEIKLNRLKQYGAPSVRTFRDSKGGIGKVKRWWNEGDVDAVIDWIQEVRQKEAQSVPPGWMKAIPLAVEAKVIRNRHTGYFVRWYPELKKLHKSGRIVEDRDWIRFSPRLPGQGAQPTIFYNPKTVIPILLAVVRGELPEAPSPEETTSPQVHNKPQTNGANGKGTSPRKSRAVRRSKWSKLLEVYDKLSQKFPDLSESELRDQAVRDYNKKVSGRRTGSGKKHPKAERKDLTKTLENRKNKSLKHP